jgi:hypothetical protein
MEIELPMGVSPFHTTLSCHQLMVVMRFLADGKIRWCFFPPNTTSDRTSKGIWLGGSEEPPEDSDGVTTAIEDVSDEETDDESDLEVLTTDKPKAVTFDVAESTSEEEEEEEEDESEGEAGRGAAGGFFAALQLEDQEDVDDDDGDDDDDESDVVSDDVDDK